MTSNRGSFDLRITREFSAPPERVFEQWSNPDYVSAWFAPEGYAVTSCDFSPSKGGRWSVSYGSGEEACTEFGEFVEVSLPNRLILTLSQRYQDRVTLSESIIVVTFEAIPNGTRMHFHQSGFDTAQRRDDHLVGWGQCFDKLQEGLAARSRVHEH